MKQNTCSMHAVICGIGILLCSACNKVPEAPVERHPQFALLHPDSTGLNFTNTLYSTKEFNVFHYMYFYNGGGVAVADFNNDGLTDIYFTANMTANALFLNEGHMHFRDVTKAAALEGMSGWTTGVCAVDINQDGLMDLYVNQLGDFRTMHGRNQLYVCTGIDSSGIPHFSEEAEKYGLDLVGFGTQATFFDMDRDGDLDMYQLNHSVHNNGTFGQRKVFLGTMHPLSGDKLMRNDNGKFVDVTAQSGIQSSVIGYGLGVATGDINLDGWPDLYICNDFHENDYLYINQHDGTFREVLTEEIQHTSRFSMGVDIADINNDGYSEIFTLDMHPYDPHILKSSLGDDGYGTFQFKLGYGYNYQYARNSLQLNNHNSTFSEIAMLAGVFNTDWSWAALFFDFDDDGLKDLFVSNGIPKRMNDIDYVNFMSNEEVQWKIRMDEMEDTDLALEEKLPEIKLPNRFFRNTGQLKFELITDVLNDAPSFSNGAAYADFDNDGDLDVVVNNISEAPFIYQNLKQDQGMPGAYLSLKLNGPIPNRQAIGARVIAYRGAQRLVKEHYPVTGYQSSVDYGIHLGLGDLNTIDSIDLIWPDGTYQRIGKDACNKRTEVNWKSGLPQYDLHTAYVRDSERVVIHDVTSETGIDFVHEENPFVEFDREQLIPQMTSTEGPPMAVGDVNGDGREDLYIGGAKHQKSVLYLQTSEGKFTRSSQPSIENDSLYEDVDAMLIDTDNDGDNDLVVASGGNEFRNQADPLRQRLYVNNGTGILVRDTAAFPGIYMTAACVAACDFDRDGDLDLFFGARAESWNYGVLPRSYLLRNDGKGSFSEATSEVCIDLEKPGLVRDAAWSDLDGDGQEDLVVAVEWGPIQIYWNRQGRLVRSDLEHTNGLWNFITVADVDGDQDLDIIAGNLGLNSKLHASDEKPLRLYVSDFDQNGQVDQLLTYYIGDREVLFPAYAEVTRQLPSIKKKFLYARDFADASIQDLVGMEEIRNASKLEASVTENSWFENTGNGKFLRHGLPTRLQFAPLEAGLVEDFDKDNAADIMLMGNFYESNVEMGRYDSDYGNILFTKDGDPLKGFIQGMNIDGQTRCIRRIHVPSGELYVIARNNASVVVVRVDNKTLDL